ncbi:hypothetical protein [Demequina sediminicola]|uniref:hypothetical protein n=1 Tax=Demequina sediminicola TaxID=1095026 RepID=UPI000780CA86|nr:hypothetical protein [Demequina sediminicola]
MKLTRKLAIYGTVAAITMGGLAAAVLPAAPASAGCGSKVYHNNYDRVDHLAIYCDRVGVRHWYRPAGSPSYVYLKTSWDYSSTLAQSGPKARFLSFDAWSRG